MSRIAKWKLEKTKVKVVFRLQFHATHIPQTGWDKLFVSFIPVDSGKPIAKTTKANVRNGSCKWADPIYETTRLLQDSKTNQYDEKLYKLVVGMGSSRSSILGEANINLADYADALRPCTVALPLLGSYSGTILNVTVQLLTSKTGFREFEQQRELSERVLQTNADHNSHYDSGGGKVSSIEDTVTDQMHKAKTGVRIKAGSKDLPALEETLALNEECTDSAAGFDGSSNTSESLCPEKHEIDSIKSTISGDLAPGSLCQSPRPTKGDSKREHQLMAQGSSDWASDYSVDNDLANANEENIRLKASLEAAESSIDELKLELNTLRSQSEVLGIETQTVSEQLLAEITSGEELAKEVSLLKADCLKCKDDLEHFKNVKLTEENNVIQLRWMKGLLFLEDKMMQLQNKACLGYHGGDVRLIHSDLQSLLGVLQNLKQGNGQFIAVNATENREMDLYNTESFLAGTEFDTALYESTAVKDEIVELLKELHESRAEKEIIGRKMDQMELYYEALVQELEENQKQMLGELQSLRNEHSTCFFTISSTKAQMEKVHEEMKEQALRFGAERHDIVSISKELERRAINSESALKRARLNYSIAVDQLQKDLDLLSFQVLSMFETNESLIKTGITAQNTKRNNNPGIEKQISGGDTVLWDLKRSLHSQEELYQKVEDELSDMHMVNLQVDVFAKAIQESLVEASTCIRFMTQKINELTHHLDHVTESNGLLVLQLQTAVDDVHVLNDYRGKCNDLVIRNQILEETLVSVSNENRNLNQKFKESEALMVELRSYKSKYEASEVEKLELENLLKKETVETGSLRGEILSLQEKLKVVGADCDDLASAKENLQKIANFLKVKLTNLLVFYDGKFRELSLCKDSLSQELEIEEFKGVILQLEELQCNTREKALQLMKENKDLLQQRDRAELENLVSREKYEQKKQDMLTKLDVSNSLVEKLQLQLEATEENYKRQNRELFSDLAQKKSALERVNEELKRSKLTISEISQRNQDLMVCLKDKTDECVKLSSEINTLNESLRCLNDDLNIQRGVRDKLEEEITNLTSQLYGKHEQFLQNEKHEKLQDQLEVIAQTLKVSCEAEEKYEKQCTELVSHLDHMEVQMELLTSQNKSLGKEIMLLESVNGDLERSKLSIAELSQKNHNLMISLGNKTEESDKLASEVINLNESLKHERKLKDELEGMVTNLTSQLIEKDEQLLHLRQVTSELFNFRQKVHEQLSSITDLETQLDEVHEVVIASNVKFIYFGAQYEGWIEVLVAQNKALSDSYSILVSQFEQNIDKLWLSKDELDVIVLVLKSKLGDEYNDELNTLKNECNELTRKLNEQIMKTEEFKSLSIHLKELKDKAEGPSESLRIAFIKEQYETKLQEMRQQLSISKKHAEEMLWKLQDAIDEVENRKKSEASRVKRNEELSVKVMELEADLQSLISEKQEKIRAFEQVNAELECASISLECSKEEKQKLNASLVECTEENSRITVELGLMKELIESSLPLGNIALEKKVGERPSSGKSSAGSPCNGTETEDRCSFVIDEGENLCAALNPIQDAIVSTRGLRGHHQHELVDQGNLLQNEARNYLAFINDRFRSQSLRSSMDYLHTELERMKKENMLRPHDDHHFDLNFQGLQRELIQLHKANEELGSIFPLFNDFSSSGNALERVLALELELAEVLQAKKKSTVHFQSSFLKQHGDEEAVFRSFRDINELIKDMLDLKGKYASVEIELKEMHDRYSQLSLQFAEVEGEREKLMMTLKNVRASKNIPI